MKDFFIWVAAILAFGAAGSTARYIHELDTANGVFSFKKWVWTTFMGTSIAVIAGLVCRHISLPMEITFAIVAVAAISSKELIDAIPGIIVKLVKTKILK